MSARKVLGRRYEVALVRRGVCRSRCCQETMLERKRSDEPEWKNESEFRSFSNHRFHPQLTIKVLNHHVSKLPTTSSGEERPTLTIRATKANPNPTADSSSLVDGPPSPSEIALICSKALNILSSLSALIPQPESETLTPILIESFFNSPSVASTSGSSPHSIKIAPPAFVCR